VPSKWKSILVSELGCYNASCSNDVYPSTFRYIDLSEYKLIILLVEYDSDPGDKLENLESLLSLSQHSIQHLPSQISSQLRSPSPEVTPPLPLVAWELDIIVNGRSNATFDKRNLDLNISYKDFLDRLDKIIATQKNIVLNDIHSY